MADYAWKQGDTEPLEVELVADRSDWTLDGSVVINIKKNGSPDMVVTRGACQIIDGSAHTVRFRPTADQTNVTPGSYLAEFENIDSEGVVRTFPSGKDDEPDYFEIQIVRQLG